MQVAPPVPALELDRVSFAYRGGPPALEDVSLSVEQGAFLGIAGPNGGGKTTLLRLALGLERPARGAVRVFGRPPGTRGTPRVANARLYWARSYAAAKHEGEITESIARDALDMAEVDRDGLDKNDRRYLETLIGVFGGGPTGVEAIAATMNLPSDTLSDEIEPYLLREQFIIRSPRGRVAMARAYQHLGKPMKRPPGEDEQGLLFE